MLRLPPSSTRAEDAFTARRSSDRPLSGKADQRARFGNMDIAQHGIAGSDAAGGGIGQHHDIGQPCALEPPRHHGRLGRSEEHTSELQSLMRISYAVFCLKTTKKILSSI